MTTSIQVSPAPVAGAPTPQPIPVVSVSADAAKLYADAVAEAKAEILAVEAALKGKEAVVAQDVGSVKAWLKSNWQHIVTWGLSGAAALDKLIALVHAI